MISLPRKRTPYHHCLGLNEYQLNEAETGGLPPFRFHCGIEPRALLQLAT
jgi:hypothetical protein